MEFSRLKYFQAVAHTGNMTKTANKLNISQPGLSKAINQLEEDLGIKLFNREGREIHLNEFGKTLLEYVDRAFLEIEEGERIIKDLAGLEKGHISVAATFPHVFPYLMAEYLKSYPHVKIKQSQPSSLEMKLMIQNNQIDFGISTFPIIADDIKWLPLADDEIFLTVPEDHPFAERKSISLKEAENERFIGLVEGYGFRDITDNYCKEAGIEPNYFLEVEDSGAILSLVKIGYGISFTPGFSLLSEHSGAVAVPIHFPNCKRTIGVAYKKNHYFSKASKNFLEYITEYFTNYAAGTKRL